MDMNKFFSSVASSVFSFVST